MRKKRASKRIIPPDPKFNDVLVARFVNSILQRGKKHLARKILLDYLKEVNRLAERPRWYNALTHNCTTVIRHHVQNVSPGNPWNWRILANGYLDELGYERGTIDTSLPFPELRARSEITAKAQAADQDPMFSQRLREGLPGQR